MSDLPKTREYEMEVASRGLHPVTNDGSVLSKADAMHDELLARIGELEDVLEMESENRTSMTARIEELEASLKLMTEYGYWKGRAEQAEAALAEREQRLDLIDPNWRGWTARAEEGSEDE